MQHLQDHRRRAAWLRTLHQWHWISAAVCLVAMLLFSVTGITLNHAAQIESRPSVQRLQDTLPPAVLASIAEARQASGQQAGSDYKALLPPALLQWLQQQWRLDIGRRAAEWSEDELYLSLPRPGGDAWLRVDTETGEIEFERTDNGWISYFNDLHKGRHTGAAWHWFIDLVAIACLLFSVTGLWIMKIHAGNRPTTWPLVGLGLLIPVLLMLLFIH